MANSEYLRKQVLLDDFIQLMTSISMMIQVESLLISERCIANTSFSHCGKDSMQLIDDWLKFRRFCWFCRFRSICMTKEKKKYNELWIYFWFIESTRFYTLCNTYVGFVGIVVDLAWLNDVSIHGLKYVLLMYLANAS